MTVFLLNLLKETDCHTMARPENGDGFDFSPIPGQEIQFNRMARQVMSGSGAFSAFSRHDGEGGYRTFQIIPHDDGAFARAVMPGVIPES
jgi:hypothetical protein